MPQSVQNFALGPSSFPQFLQGSDAGAPQSAQNFAPGTNGDPHLWQGGGASTAKGAPQLKQNFAVGFARGASHLVQFSIPAGGAPCVPSCLPPCRVGATNDENCWPTACPKGTATPRPTPNPVILFGFA